ncbi:MAG: NADH-quinone oxidoreductase subunit M [Acidobacteriaceae bacterium]|jgi:NADH-quinone oxidoreductase subunit M
MTLNAPMNFDHIILTVIVFTPLAGTLLLALLPDRGKTMQWGALAVTLFTFLCTLHLPAHYSYTAHPGTYQFEQDLTWINSPGAPAIQYHLGVDGLSMWLIVLTGFLAPLGVLISWRAIGSRKKLFYVLFLLQQVAMMGIFVSLNLFLYYAFWEMSLVPMTILIATFSRSGNGRKAAIKYFLYAFIPSALLLVAMLWLYAQTATLELPALAQLAAQHAISPNSTALWFASLAFLFAFAVKVPVFPLHGWLSDAIFEAPTAAVMVLAGKTGLYSILRFSFAIFPTELHRIAPLMIALGAIGIVYGALIALVQHDLKRLAAYSTLGHLSVVTLGIFTFTIAGLDGGVFQILSESLAGAALFMLLGLLFERYGSYDMRQYGGLAAKLPWVVTMFVITALAAIGLPMLSGFVGEFLILSSTMQSHVPNYHLWTALATTGVIFSAAYMLTMIQRVFYADLGPRPASMPARDLDIREHLALWPMVALFLALGVASPLWMQAIDTYGVSTAAPLSATIPQIAQGGAR